MSTLVRMKKIGILGLGAMGARMARRLLAAGHDVVVFNRTRDRADSLVEAGAVRAETPRSAAEGRDVVISVVRDDEASRAVWLHPETGALGALARGSVAIESSTVTPAWTAELAKAVSERKARFLDAPVVGSRPQAEAGQLIHLVGGDASALESVRDVLLALGGAVHHVGLVGAGMSMKLAVNALFAVQVAGLAEVLGALRRGGVDDTRAVEILSAMPTTSAALKGVGALMATRRFEPMFPITLVEKDLGYAVDSAERHGGSTPTTRAVREVYARAIDAGYGDDHIAGVAKLFD